MEEYKDYLDFKMKTGLSGIEAVELLLDELKKLRENREGDNERKRSVSS